MNLAERADELRTTNTNAAEGSRERVDVVVIGAGQAGLAIGHFLARAGRRFVIVDGAAPSASCSPPARARAVSPSAASRH
jgi:2-polyprenyl-6-methoxyphenol hydroxylase-like FAD-dependent oxidoreductase